MRYYLSGPMTGIPEYNFPAFHEAAAVLRQRGYNILNPAELKRSIEDNVPRSFYLRGDLKELLDCQGIILLPGWEFSRGAELELGIARQLDFDVLEYEQIMLRD